jgi:signal transduction histidine kinase
LIVVCVGILAALAVTSMGVLELQRESDYQLGLRAQAIGQSLAPRLASAAPGDRRAMVRAAQKRDVSRLWLLSADGRVLAGNDLVADADVARDFDAKAGVLDVRGGTYFYARTAIDPNGAVVVAVAAARPPPAATTLVFSVAALAALLVGMAGLVALAVLRDVRADVEYTRRRVGDMSRAGSGPTGQPIPVRSVDQVGLLTSAFNALVERFLAADHAYRLDLAQALTSDRQRAAFLAALSHELRTPLNAILGFTDVLLAEVDGPLSAEAQENLLIVRNSGHHLRALIDDILDLSALESGELSLAPREVDVFSIAEEVVKELTVTAKAKDVQLILDGEPTIAWADPKRVRQILSNVLSNAVKFTNEGSVTLDIFGEPSWARICVTDTGPGIATEHQSAIFDDYKQVGDKRMRGFGTGLGLAITRRLVSMHRGSIELESSVGVGSSFTIFLPTTALDPLPCEEPPEGEGDAEDDVEGVAEDDVAEQEQQP